MENDYNFRIFHSLRPTLVPNTHRFSDEYHGGGLTFRLCWRESLIRRIIIRQNGTLVLFGPSLSLKNPDSNIADK